MMIVIILEDDLLSMSPLLSLSGASELNVN